MDYFEEQDGKAVNPSTEPTIGEVISRRTFLKGAAATGAFGLFGCATTGTASDAPSFTEVPRSTSDRHQVPPGYNAQVLLRQGDPIKPGAPEYNPPQTGRQQEQQFGTDADFISYMPLPYGSNNSTRGLLGVNHENHRANLCFPGNPKQLTREQVEVQMAGAGLLDRRDRERGERVACARQPLQPTDLDERADAFPARLPDIRACRRADPSGTRSFGTPNCAGGTTPWGTMLTAEENIQNYFSGDAGKGPEAARASAIQHQRQGAATPTGDAISTASTSTRNQTSRTASAGSSRSIRTIRTTHP